MRNGFRVAAPLAVIGTIVLVNPAIRAKLGGQAPECSWGSILESRQHRVHRYRTAVRVDRMDRDLVLVKGLARPFWAPSGGEMGPAELIDYLASDHESIAGASPAETVQAGEVVLDVGAHVGVFTALALKRGASKIYAIEPDPLNLECLRRNLAPEIASGIVKVIPYGAWSSETTMVMNRSIGNSGGNSLITAHGTEKYQVGVQPIDQMLGGAKVDFIKMDIEGAEREALKGARQTIERWQPRLMLDSYHRPGDMKDFRRILRDYTYTCTFCVDITGNGYHVPYVTFWRAM